MPLTLPSPITSTAAVAASAPISLPSRSPLTGSGTGASAFSRRLSLLSSVCWVSIELFLTLSQILAAIVVLALSQNEHPQTPLPVWVIGYAVGCGASLPLLYWRYIARHPPAILIFMDEQGGTALHQITYHAVQHHHQYRQRPVSIVTHSDSHNPISNQYVFSGVTRVRVEMCMERLRMTLDCFFAVWFVLGTVWVFGRPSAAQESPKLYRLCVAFLAMSCMSYAMPFVVCAAVCCCLPCLISLLGIGDGLNRMGTGWDEGRGASDDTVAALPIVRFRSKRMNRHLELEGLPASSYNDVDDTDCSTEGGLIGAGTQFEHVISGDDAACCICLGMYRDNAELRGLPCSHHFHVECVDQWLKINASCPLCKFSLQGGKLVEGESVDIPSVAGGRPRLGRRLAADEQV
ncbi:hypothetical protein GOP47_0020481 [Adiantum capillus-veneris]|uniref:RING-type domain-containing protein n=1 Tax=Adiantum capillus-veneris TaxID=13818 RepID=A0A9D4UB60_ADICA|nr:hypothetical protein GOP47_0020481 [Adiantum capillus-veneris]